MSAAHVGDIGTLIKVQVIDSGRIVDIRNASVIQFKIQRPSGTIIVKPGEFTNSGMDGKIQYAVEDGVFNQQGVYHINAYLELPVWRGHTTGFDINVMSL